MVVSTTLRAAVYGRESQARAKSITDQLRLAAHVVTEHGWAQVASYDDGTSASRYARKARPGWKVLIEALHSRTFDVLVLWEASRGSRQLVEWATLLDACRIHGVRIHLVGDERTYDLRRSADYNALAQAGVNATHETDKLSDRSQRGIDDAVRLGRPPMGKVPYGYRRVYDPDSGDLAGQELDPEAALKIKRLFERVAEGASITQAAGELGWERRAARDRLRNPAYAGLRRHRRQGRNGDGRGQLHEGDWPAIVSPELFYDVQAILDAHQGAGRRPSRQKHLLSGIAECGVCDKHLTVRFDHYRCHAGHIQVSKADLDELVEATIVEALASPALYAKLRQAHEQSSVEAQQARDEHAKLTARLKDYRARARRGTIDADDFEAIAIGLKADIAAAKARADQAALPPALRQFVEPGVDVEARWDAAELLAKRDVIRALARIVVRPVGRRGVPVADRVDITTGR